MTESLAVSAAVWRRTLQVERSPFSLPGWPNQSTIKGETFMPADLEHVTRRIYSILVGAEGTIDDIDGLFDSSFVDHNPDPDQLPGPEGIKTSAMQLRARYPGVTVLPQALYVCGDTVISRLILANAPLDDTSDPVSPEVLSEIIEILRFEGGMVVERWGLIDRKA